jgi:hypothetical protein
MPDHQMMVGIKSWQQQVPLPQPYTGGNAWQVPLAPVRADQAISGRTGLFRGAIALAMNGVPIFNALNNRGDDAYLAGELDDWGGHSGKADDYHYHVAPIHLQTSPDRPIAYALDGYALYGLTEADGSAVQGLDELNGHAHGGGVYHYHATRTYPYINGGMRGVVTIKEEQIDPQAIAAAVRPPYEPLRGAVITGFRATGAKSWTLEHSNGGAVSSVRYRIEGDSYIFEYVDASGAVRTETYRAPGQGAPASQAPQQTAQATKAPSTSGFVLTSAGVTSGILAADHTCDGTSSSPPLAWSGAPAGTQSFALVLWHEAGAGDLHWYWTLYNIAASVTSLPKNVSGVGTFGGNSVNPQAAYAAPCSKGPGLKTYRFTLYALSDPPKLSGLPTSDSASVTRDSLLKAIEGRTLGSTELTVQYERK